MGNNRTLLEAFPDLAQQWDYEKNGSLTPNTISAGSHKEVYWICPICHQSYKKKVCNRTCPSKRKIESPKCPVCLGRIIIPGFNSLKAKFREIVDREWDYEKNDVDPDTVAPHTNKKYWWKCPNGHPSHLSSASNKIAQTGGNCPLCSHQKLSYENSLLAVNPLLAEEWNYDLNDFGPDEVFANSNKTVFWRCKNGHVWKAKINNRNNGKGCPECSKGRHSSFPEQVIYYYIKKFFPDAINGFKSDKTEIDIFIPSLLLGIEYDGDFYHKGKDRIERDKLKTRKLIEKGIKLIRIRESACPVLNDDSIVIEAQYSSDYSYLNLVIIQLFAVLEKMTQKTFSINVDIDEIRADISEKLSVVAEEKSLLSLNPLLAAEWDYERNAPLLPTQVIPKSSKTVFWICSKCGYKWEAVISSRNRGCGCPRCANRENYTTETWIKQAKVVHGNKYDYSQVDYVNSKTPIIIICPKHGVFTQAPGEHLSGKGCKYCAHQAFHKKDSLAVIAPSIAAEWDYERNKESGYTPETIGINSTKKFYRHCNNGKPHSYLATIASRVYRHSGCAVCHGKQIAHDTSLAFIHPELAKEWCEFNDIKPCDVSCGSEKKVWWKCSNPLHKPYQATIYSRVRLHSGCPECAGNIKSSASFQQELAVLFPNIKLLSPYVKSSVRVKCICLQCGYQWESFPYNLLKKKTGCPQCKSSRMNEE